MPAWFVGSLRRASGVYVFVGLVVLFAVWVPETFLTTTTLSSVLSQSAVTALVAVGLVVPLVAGVFDISVGYTMGMAAVMVSWLMVKQGWNPAVAVLATLAIGAVIGLVNGLLVVRFAINAFIATLGTSSILAGLIVFVSGKQQIVGLPSGFTGLATWSVMGVPAAAVYLVVVALVLWFVLEHMPVGRRLYAAGCGEDAARLAGVRTGRLIVGSFVTSAVVASIAGIVLTARIGAGSPQVGPSYVFPAFAAAFLGATQFKPDRFNVWGTVLAVYLLAVGVRGLNLIGAAFWVTDLFNGLALILAVGLASRHRYQRVSRIPRRLVRQLSRQLSRPEHERVAVLKRLQTGRDVQSAPPAVHDDRTRGSWFVGSLRRASGVYVFVGLVVLFAVWVPETFLTTTTLSSVLSQSAVTALVAVGLVVPLVAGVFDISVGYTMGMAAVMVSWLMVKQGWNPAVAVLATLAIGAVIGLVNGLLVVRFAINAFIATLGTSSILAGLIVFVSGKQQIVGLPSGFTGLATWSVMGVPAAAVYLVVVALVLWFVLEHMPVGRRLYAAGCGEDAARLAGVRTGRLIVGSFVTSAVVASIAGIVLTARIGAGSPQVGPSYLLPAFAAAFLGATQFKPDRFNVWGTVLAVYLLAVGVRGLNLIGAAFWVTDLFNGLALILAVGLATSSARRGAVSRRRWRRAGSRPDAATVESSAAGAAPATA